jgi:threonyl-tRNA synthetase
LLENNEIRALIDNRNETMGKKIRDAEIKKIPFMIVVGEQEENTKTLSVRQHGGGDLGTLKVSEFSKIIEDEINKTLKQF